MLKTKTIIRRKTKHHGQEQNDKKQFEKHCIKIWWLNNVGWSNIVWKCILFILYMGYFSSVFNTSPGITKHKWIYSLLRTLEVQILCGCRMFRNLLAIMIHLSFQYLLTNGYIRTHLKSGSFIYMFSLLILTYISRYRHVSHRARNVSLKAISHPYRRPIYMFVKGFDKNR